MLSVLNCFFFIILIYSTETLYGRENIQGAIRTSMGLQVDKSCLDEAKKLNSTPQHLLATLEKGLQDAQDKVGGKCPKRYPQIKMYTDQWLEQLKNTVLLCGDGNSKEFQNIKGDEEFKKCQAKYQNDFNLKCKKNIKFQGLAFYNKKTIEDFFSVESTKRLFPTKLKSNQSLSQQKKGVIAIGQNLLKDLLQGNIAKTMKTITHEIFHLTEANNRHDHNEIESITFYENDYYDLGDKTNNKVNFCSNNITKDRINTLTSLCLDTPIPGTYNIKAARALSIIRSQCGERRGCIDIFFHKDNQKKEGEGKDLDEINAKNLCRKILYEGSCLDFMERNGLEAFLNMAPVKISAQQLTDYIENFFPNSPDEIPQKLMELMLKNSQLNISQFETDPCLNTIIEKSPSSGNWKLKGSPSIPYQDKNKRWDDTIIAENYSKLLDNTLKRMENIPRCKNKINNYQDYFKEMKNKAANVFQSELLNDLKRRAIYKTLEESNEPDIKSESFNAKKNRAFIHAMGEERVMPYLLARRQYHPAAPYFNCTTSPLIKNTYFNYTYSEMMKTYWHAGEIQKSCDD